MNPSIFKAYDIRGIYPSDIDEDTVYAIGRAAVTTLGFTTVAVGRDARESGPALHAALIRGICDAGGRVVDLGMITTPMLYFASWHLPDVDGAIAVTASHNPAEYNGIKICRRDAKPVGGESGLNDVRETVTQLLHDGVRNTDTDLPTDAVRHGDIRTPYYDYIASFARFEHAHFSVVIDCANTMGVLELPLYERFRDAITVIPLYCDLDHPYTAHEANPLNTATLDELRSRVVETGAALGIAYDGDADRIGFVDERGEIIPMDLITGLLARVLLTETPGATVLYDLRSSRAVKEVIEESGGVARECRVGHAFIKEQMREYDALFAGELSGHYYFRANKNGELSTLAAFTILNLMARTGTRISRLVTDLRRYYHSGEINSTVHDPDTVIATLKERYSDGECSELDGVKISYWDGVPHGQRWWFNVRASNTEPLLRLNMEADTEALLHEKQDELLRIIRG